MKALDSILILMLTVGPSLSIASENNVPDHRTSRGTFCERTLGSIRRGLRRMERSLDDRAERFIKEFEGELSASQLREARESHGMGFKIGAWVHRLWSPISDWARDPVAEEPRPQHDVQWLKSNYSNAEKLSAAMIHEARKLIPSLEASTRGVDWSYELLAGDGLVLVFPVKGGFGFVTPLGYLEVSPSRLERAQRVALCERFREGFGVIKYDPITTDGTSNYLNRHDYFKVLYTEDGILLPHPIFKSLHEKPLALSDLVDIWNTVRPTTRLPISIESVGFSFGR